MKFLIALFGFVACASGFVRGLPTQEGRVVGGSPTTIQEVPYIAALLYDYWQVGTYTQYCGATIVSRNVILTAGHCMEATLASQWRVRAGSTLHNTGGQVVAVSRYIIHPGFNARLDSDMALAFLAANLALSTDVALVSLPANAAAIEDGTNAMVTGWGSLTAEGGTQPVQLYSVNVTTVNLAQCAQIYATFNPVTERQVCAGRLGVGGADACQGDSGGPLVAGNVQIGVASWGRSCATPQYPGVYARVASFRNWIDTNVEEARIVDA